MTEHERIIRALTIMPEDLGRWTRICRKVGGDLYRAHPEYPRLTEMQLLSFVKRLLPEIRVMISNSGDDTPSRTP